MKKVFITGSSVGIGYDIAKNSCKLKNILFI